MKCFLTVCLTTLMTLPAFGQATGPRNAFADMGTLIDGANLGAASNSFSTSSTNRPRGMGLVALYISLTDADNSVTALNMSCTGSNDDNVTDYTLQSCLTALGVCTSYNASWVRDPSLIASPKRWVWRVDVEGVSALQCTFTDTGGAAADLITIIGQYAVKGG